MPVNLIALAEQFLGAPLDIASQEGGKIIAFGPCPGAHRHTTKSGPRDFRLIIDPTGQEMPHEHCFHGSCQSERDAFIRDLIRAIRAAERQENGGKTIARPRQQPARQDTPPRPEKPVFSRETAYAVAARCDKLITEEFLRRISPVAIPADRTLWPELLIDSLYAPGERVLIFTAMQSQGQFLRVAGKGNYRLGHKPGIQAQPCQQLPTEGPEGVWFLCAPVLGSWQPNPSNIDRVTKQPKPGRRHADCCTAFRYAVIESDTISPAVWLNIVALLQDRVAAVYTSGSKSVHTLLHLGDCQTAAEFNRHRQALLQRLVPVGADPAALTPVRLTRLPGCLRLNKRGADGQPALQRLLYLNPSPQPHQPLKNMPFLRT